MEGRRSGGMYGAEERARGDRGEGRLGGGLPEMPGSVESKMMMKASGPRGNENITFPRNDIGTILND